MCLVLTKLRFLAPKKGARTDAHNFDERSKVINTADNNSGVPTDVENPKGSKMKPAGGGNQGEPIFCTAHSLIFNHWGPRYL